MMGVAALARQVQKVISNEMASFRNGRAACFPAMVMQICGVMLRSEEEDGGEKTIFVSICLESACRARFMAVLLLAVYL